VNIISFLRFQLLVVHQDVNDHRFLILGFSSDQEIIDLLGDSEYLRNTLEKDSTENTEQALLEIYERLRPGEPPTVENAKSLFR
jgi:hypothetical protein